MKIGQIEGIVRIEELVETAIGTRRGRSMIINVTMTVTVDVSGTRIESGTVIEMIETNTWVVTNSGIVNLNMMMSWSEKDLQGPAASHTFRKRKINARGQGMLNM